MTKEKYEEDLDLGMDVEEEALDYDEGYDEFVDEPDLSDAGFDASDEVDDIEDYNKSIVKTGYQDPQFNLDDFGIKSDSFEDSGNNPEVVAVWKKWKAGKISDNDYCLYLMSKCSGLIKNVIKRYHTNKHCDYEVLMQESYMVILEKFREYDPKYKLSTFFFFPFSTAQRMAADMGPSSAYYEQQKKKLDWAARQLGMEDCLDERVPCFVLSDMTGINEKTVRSIRSIKTKAVCSFELVKDSISEMTASPQELVEKQEDLKQLEKALAGLTEAEKYVLVNFEGNRVPAEQISAEMNRLLDAGQKLDGIDGYIDENEVRELSNKAILKIRKKSRYFEAYDPGLVKQIEIEDIDMDNINLYFDDDEEKDGAKIMLKTG